MPKGQTGRLAAKVASRLGCDHVYCPACSHEIKLTNLVSWYLRSLVDNIISTGKPIRLRGLGTWYAKPGAMLGWRTEALLASQLAAQNSKQETENTGHQTHGNGLQSNPGGSECSDGEGSL